MTPTAAPYPSLRQVLILALVAFPLIQLLLLPLVEDAPPALALALAEGTLLLLAVVMIRRRGWVVEDLFLLNAVSLRTLALVLPLGVAAGLLAGEVDTHLAGVWRWLDWTAPLAMRRNVMAIQIVRTGADILPVFLAIGVIPAVCEETFFRGFVYTGLRYHHGPQTAMLMSAAVFAVAHLNPWQFPAFFLLGLWLAWLVHHTHSIYPAILAHALNNLLSVAAVNLRVHWGIDPLGALQPLPAGVLALALVTFVAGIRRLRRLPPCMPLLSPFVPPRRL